MNSLWTLTKREKLGTIDGINLFFGALLGANLGTLGTLSLRDYVTLIVLLAGIVTAIRMVSLSERRAYALATLAACMAIVATVLFVPGLQPDGLGDSDLHRLMATLVIWVASTMAVELCPTREGPET